jgi:hypothetical protein
MTDPRFDDRRDLETTDSMWTWLPGALFAVFIVAGVALWAYSSGDPPRIAGKDSDATTGQSQRPPMQPNPARPAPDAPAR